MSDLNVERIMDEIKSRILKNQDKSTITEANLVRVAESSVKERLQTILNQNSTQSEKLKYLESLNSESSKSSSLKSNDITNNDLYMANISVDIQTQTKIDTSKPKIIRPLVLKIRHILQDEIRSTLNPIVNNQIRYNSHLISALNSIAKSVNENSQEIISIAKSVNENSQEIKSLKSGKENPPTLETLSISLVDFHKNLDIIQSQITELNIGRLYNHYLQREPSSSDIHYWMSYMKSHGLQNTDLANLILSSDEAKQIQKSRLQSKGIQVEENNVAFKKINDNVFYFDVADKVLVESFSKDEIHERGMTEIIKKLIKSKMNVINIGANIGYFTVLLAKQVLPNGKVFAFEPYPPNIKFLQKNIEINKCKNVEIVPKAVSNKIQKVNLWLKDSGTQNFVSQKEQSEFDKIEIETITIDHFLNEKNAKINFVLIDAEGYEQYILEGMQKTLNTNPHLEMIVEYNPYTLEVAGTSGKAFLDFIEKLGFSIFLIDEKDGEIKHITKNEILEQFRYPNVANLYLTKKPKDF